MLESLHALLEHLAALKCLVLAVCTADNRYLFLCYVYYSSCPCIHYLFNIAFNLCLQEEVKEESDDDMGFGLFD